MERETNNTVHIESSDRQIPMVRVKWDIGAVLWPRLCGFLRPGRTAGGDLSPENAAQVRIRVIHTVLISADARQPKGSRMWEANASDAFGRLGYLDRR